MVVLYGPEVCFDTKTDVGQPLFQWSNKTTIEQKDKPQELAPKGCLESAPSKTGVSTSEKKTRFFLIILKTVLQ